MLWRRGRTQGTPRRSTHCPKSRTRGVKDAEVLGSGACEFALHQLLGVAAPDDQYTCCSDSGADLDPRLVHRLEACGLHLGILVRDSADGVVPPAVDDLVRMRSD